MKNKIKLSLLLGAALFMGSCSLNYDPISDYSELTFGNETGSSSTKYQTKAEMQQQYDNIYKSIQDAQESWTCPKWMKVNNLTEKQPFDSWTSGQLNPDYYQDYATYFVKYIQAMKAEGINIASMTVQNEPLNRGNSVSLYMTWQEQRDFIKTALGPTFRKAGINTKIIIFDHNYNYDNIADQIDYPINIYKDADAAQYIDGAGFHGQKMFLPLWKVGTAALKLVMPLLRY